MTQPGRLLRVEGLGDFLELEVVLAPVQSAADGEVIAQGLLAQRPQWSLRRAADPERAAPQREDICARTWP